MITQKQESNKDLSTGEEVETIYISDQELELLAQELAREYGDFLNNNVIGTD